MKKEVFSIFFLLLMFACACPLAAQTVNVGTADELEAIAAQSATEDFSGQTITLTADIDLGGRQWSPIGTKDLPFKGTFDGNGHLIKGLRAFAGTATDGVGLFGYIAQEGVVENLGINGGTLVAKTKRRIGTIAGVCDGTIRQCWSMAEIAVAGNVVGGLVGDLTGNGVIEDCYQSGLILNGADTIGGIVGRNAGKLIRVYNTGYAKNGKAIVGLDEGGSYTDCYYDRKVYYQMPGVEGDKIHAIDVTKEMFSVFEGNAAWTTGEVRYPVLTRFAATDAAKLSAAPMYIDTDNLDPVNHANDLTAQFQVSVEDGITWECQDESDKQWIQISGEDVTVVRPCTETDVLVDSKLGTETRVVYMRPRRVEDLLAGDFTGWNAETGEMPHINGYCFESTWKLAMDCYMTLAEEGWIGTGDYHYKVELWEIAGTDTTYVRTIKNDMDKEDMTSTEYTEWFRNFYIPTDVAGHFLLRSFVHDNGCVPGWIENKLGFEFVVFGEFVPGEIVTKTDTILLNTIPTFVNGASKSESYGGGGPVYYQWFVNGDTIPSQTGLNLEDYPISEAGTYKFTRGTHDSICYTPESTLDYLGIYTVVAFDPFDPGEISNHSDTIFCDIEDAKAYVIDVTPATGGVSDKGYHYEWYIKNGSSETRISGANGEDLALSSLDLTAGYDYTFIRKAKDNTRFTTLTDSRYSKKIHIMAPLTPGAIANATLANFCFEADATGATTATITVSEREPAVCADGLEYRWIRNPGNTVIATTRELNYTFSLSEITLGVNYTYTREVRNTNPDCAWIPSSGYTEQKYGQKGYQEITTIVCQNDLPLTMTLENGQTHVFNSASDTWTVTDNSGDCPNVTVYKLELATMPNFHLDEFVSWCQTTGTLSINYTDDPTIPTNVFHIEYSSDLANRMGKNDTTGVITTPGVILFENVPDLGDFESYDLYMLVKLGYRSETASGACYSTSHMMRLYPRLGGYVYSKYDRVVFVDNNPENGALPDVSDKLEFVSYQWYKNGLEQPGQTGQYYHEGGALLNGVFYCKLVDSKGTVHRTCEITLPAESGSSAPQATAVYPVPVSAGEALTIDGFGSAQIVSLSGERIRTVEEINSRAVVNAPGIPGIYFVQITTEEGVVESHKLIVK